MEKQIAAHLASLPEPKQGDMRALHELILRINPKCKLWFDNGLNEAGKPVTHPTIGYGDQVLTYANGSTKPFFQIGISANATGITIYFIGLSNKNYLKETFGTTIGKATVTGYCFKLKKLSDLNETALKKALNLNYFNTP